MKENTSLRLKRLLSEKGIKQVDVLKMAEPYCRKYNIKLSKSDLSQYVTGKVAPGQEKLTILGMALGVSEAWLMGYDVPMKRDSTRFQADSKVPDGFQPLPEMSSVPRVGRIACGTPILAEENIEALDSVPSAWRADFTLVCVGDSMTPRIQDGDLVAVRKQDEVENGEIAAVRIDNEATLKRVFVFPDHIELRAENPAFPTIIRIGEAMNDVHIEGKAVGLCRGI